MGLRARAEARLVAGGYDANMSYPPQGGPQDPYNLNQPQQPGGPVPGPSGQGYQFDGPQSQYGQPDQTQPYQQDPYGQPQGYQQGGYPQQGYPQQPYTDPYGGYGPPPVQATAKSSSGGIVLVVVVVLLMIAGGVAGYLLLGDRDSGTTTAGGDSTTSPAGDDETSEDDDSDDDDVEVPADSLVVDALGGVTPMPEGAWDHRDGPGAQEQFATDAHSVWISHTETWGSLFYVGRLNAVDIVYNSSDLPGTATDVVTAWASHFEGYTEGLKLSDVTTAEHTVDGRPAVLAEATVSWDEVQSITEDEYERIAVLIIDVDGANAFVGVASIAESGDDDYGSAVDALLATTFQ
jgi:hypothetical protein